MITVHCTEPVITHHTRRQLASLDLPEGLKHRLDILHAEVLVDAADVDPVVHHDYDHRHRHHYLL